MRRDVKRLPSFGLGCVAGAAGIARVHDYLAGHPQAVGLLLTVELCSLTIQHDDLSMANVIAGGLFGDGAAAVIMVGQARAAQLGRAGYDVIATRSALYHDTGDLLGWTVGSSGLRIVLGAGIPKVIEEQASTDVLELLTSAGLSVAEIGEWIVHPGGPKILEAFAASLGLIDDDLAHSWCVLAQVGNLSSAGVLHVLSDALNIRQKNDLPAAVVFAVGPGVTTATLLLLRWHE